MFQQGEIRERGEIYKYVKPGPQYSDIQDKHKLNKDKLNKERQ